MREILAQRPNKTISRQGDLVYKVFDETFSKADILNEALNQARVEETGLNIPKLMAVTVTEAQRDIVLEFIPGQTLESLMNENPDQEEVYLEKFVDLQLEMHKKTCPMLNRLNEKMKRKIHESDFSSAIKYDLLTRLASMPKHHKVCHGDFNPSNIMVTPEGVPYILDWSHATQGNASHDAARTYLLFRLKGEDARAEKYLDLFCQKSKTKKYYVQAWMPIVAASQSVKSFPEERAFLESWVNVFDFE